MKRLKNVMLFGVMLFTFAACQKSVNVPIDPNQDAPGPIRNPVVENISGGAKISYTLPKTENLLYVKAVYEVNGQLKEAKSSFFKNEVIVEGYGDTKEHQVSLYAVSRAEKVSEEVKVTIKPLTPAIVKVRESLLPETSFGGFTVQFLNRDAASIVIMALRWDESQKEWRMIDANYTALDSGIFKVRGQEAVPQQFGLVVRDRWNNLSDTMKFQLTPIYEEQLDKTKFVDIRKKFPIPQVFPLPVSGKPMIEVVDYNTTYPMKNLYDGNTGSMFHTKQNVDQPAWIPIDMGAKAKLSRYKIWQRGGNSFAWNHGNPHEWELWGTNTPADVNSWVKLDHQISVKPSGLPLGQNSNEDLEVATNGIEYEFPDGIPAVRYIAWKAIDCWGAVEGQTGFFHLMELTIWGQKQ